MYNREYILIIRRNQLITLNLTAAVTAQYRILDINFFSIPPKAVNGQKSHKVATISNPE